MFKEIEPEVDGSAVTFGSRTRYPCWRPWSPTQPGSPVWMLHAKEYQRLPETSVVTKLQAWPEDEAPAKVMAMLRQVEERVERELAEHGPPSHSSPVSSTAWSPSDTRPRNRLCPCRRATTGFSSLPNRATVPRRFGSLPSDDQEQLAARDRRLLSIQR
jgi:hypothetical protein